VAQSRLPELVRSAARGESVRIKFGKKLLELHAVAPESAEHRYGVTTAELRRFAKKIHAEIEENRKAGELRDYNGDINAVLES
jgi:hypothetical protein